MQSDTLLIVGNGFDLQCGLKSNYENFAEWLKENENRKNNNLWAVHFVSKPPVDYRWTDIEESLKKVWLLDNRFNDSHINQWVSSANNRDISTKLKEVRYIIRHNENTGMELPRPFEHWVLSELEAFENQFVEYLNMEISNNTSYLTNVETLLNELMDNCIVDILSFNYTNPFADIKRTKNKLSDMPVPQTNPISLTWRYLNAV